jgi:bacterioferritin (cytochrome b1)
LRNAGIQTSSTRTETSVERMLREQLAAEQESLAALIDQGDELKRKTKKTKRELEEYKKRQQEEYNNLCELCTRFNSSGNSQPCTPAA